MSASDFKLKVECYSGYRSEEEPRRFFLGTKPVLVQEIIDRWISPEHRYFKIRGEDHGIYILRHDAVNDLWDLSLYNSGTREDAKLSST